MLAELKAVARANFGPTGVEFLKHVRKTFRRSRRYFSPRITKEKLIWQLGEAGIKRGDILFVHSSLGSLGNIVGGAKTVIDALQAAVGREGTLVTPNFVGVSRVKQIMDLGGYVDLRTEPGRQGAIPEVLRLSKDVFRSSHPLSSCCAWGKNAEYVTSGHENDDRICHKESPLGKMLELNGKIIALGVDMAPISFYHVVEDLWEDFPLNVYDQPFLSKYIDNTGKQVERYVRTYLDEVRKTRIEVDSNLWIRKKITTEFDRMNYRKKFLFGSGKSWFVNAHDFYNQMIALAKKSLTIYTTKHDWEQRYK